MTRTIEGRLFEKFSTSLCLFEEGWSLDLFGLFIPIPVHATREPYELMESWGFTFHERTVHLNWGRHTKIIRFPWDWEHLKHEVQRPDGSWVPYVASYDKGEPDGRWQAAYPYEYQLRSGDIQHRTATIYVNRREWRWKWLMWSPWPAIKRQSIDVTFDDEVGERAGSWKGGTIGCGYDMQPGETPLQTLRRMEGERRFR